MVRIIISIIVLFVFVRWAWKVWGKDFSNDLGDELVGELSGKDYERREELLLKIKDLEREVKNLKLDSEDYERRENLAIEIESLKEEKKELDQRFNKMNVRNRK